jgi:uncharacterized protein
MPPRNSGESKAASSGLAGDVLKVTLSSLPSAIETDAGGSDFSEFGEIRLWHLFRLIGGAFHTRRQHSLLELSLSKRLNLPTYARGWIWFATASGIAFLSPAPAGAQSFDCTKARPPIEIAICAAPDLVRLDTDLGRRYGQVIAGIQQADPIKAQQMRGEQRQWVTQRDQKCTPLAATPAQLTACLAGAYRDRMAALTAVAATPAPSFPPDTPAAAAALSRATLSASADDEVLLTVTSPGRFSIRATSKTGVALQLVDMIAGPGDISGDAGSRDGRLDVLLDTGTYKIRGFGTKGATGQAALSVAPFQAVQVASRDLLRGGQASGEIRDLQQRSFWVLVDASQQLTVEAAGRSLQDLRAWRNGIDLADLTPNIAVVEPKAGHQMTRLRLEGAVEPGLYLVTAYGGEALPWADGDTSQPFHIRTGPPPVMAGGWFEGTIGPLGSMRFRIPAPATYVRLQLPEPAPARLSAGRTGTAVSTAAIAKNSREPVASLTVPTSDSAPLSVEVSGLEGQRFQLRALQPATSLRVGDAGPHLVSVDVAGEGGDEVPATALLARFGSNGSASVVASDVPRIALGNAWRKRFNLRGPTSLIFEITGAGPVAARIAGPGVRATLEPLLDGAAPRSDGKIPLRWDVEAGWYVLKLDPVANAVGILDLTFGQPGLAVDPPAPTAPRTAIDFGIQTLDKSAYYQVFANSAPGLVTGPKAVALPADLATAPLTLQQLAKVVVPSQPISPPVPAPASTPAPAPRTAPAAAPQPNQTSAQTKAKNSQAKSPVAPKPLPPKPAPVRLASAPGDHTLVIPIRVPVGGTLSATEPDGRQVAIATSGETIAKGIRSLTVTIAPVDRVRTIVLAWTKGVPQAPIPTIDTKSTDAILVAGKPQYFDLASDGRRGFRLEVPQGGLFHVETLGRLKTSATIATPFLPKLAEASDNGAGHNALLQTYLRAGSYRVGVTAQDSQGHLGIIARPAPLIDAGVLVPEGSARATLAQGSGAVFSLDIPQSGNYRLDLYGLDRTFTSRLEDSDGWPLAAPGELEDVERHFDQGHYRLVVLPQEVDARVVARLRRNEDPVPLEGHGPHPLPFDSAQKFEWREPQDAKAPRLPDRWEFTLAAAAHVTLDISDGMIGNLLDVGGDPKSIAKIVYKRGFSGVLQPGRYAVEAKALGRNDRLDYELDLKSTEIQPGEARNVDLPATIPFVLATDGVVNLTSYGRTDLIGVLKDADGHIVERLSGRADDWNIALSRRLAAGTYQLDLAAAKNAAQNSGGNDGDQPAADDNSSDEQAAGDPPADAAPSATDDTASSDDRDDTSDPAVEVRFDLPAVADEGALATGGTQQIAGPQAHLFALPAVDAGKLLLVTAHSPAELALSLERLGADGKWQALSFDRGRAPIVAVPADSDSSRPWRVSVWAVDGGNAQINITARAVAEAAQPLGEIRLSPLAIDGMPTTIAVAAVASPQKTIVDLHGQLPDLMQGSTPGRPLVPTENGTLAPQSDIIWFVARDATPSTFSLDALKASDREFALDLAAGDTAFLPANPVAAGHLRIWQAHSTFGQPGISTGGGMGIIDGGAIAIGGATPVHVWNAGGREPLRLRVGIQDVEMRNAVSVGAHYDGLLPPHSAQPLHLPAGAHLFDVDIGPNIAAAFSRGDGRPSSIWSGPAATTRRLAGKWSDLTLVNIGDVSSPINLDITPASEDLSLAAGSIFKRFFGAAGSLALNVTAAKGDRLIVVGGSATFIGSDGNVLRGRSMDLSSSGELVVEHGAGLVAAWIENHDKTPWTTGPAIAVAAPQTVSLGGQAMRFTLKLAAASVLQARTTAPVIVSVLQNGGGGEPILFPAGAELHRYMAAGDVELRLYSPHDGPLAGTLELNTSPVIEIAEGIGDPQALAPGASALFGFQLAHAAQVGVGVRSDPDRATVQLLDADGKLIGDGVAQLRMLQAGTYLLSATAPPTGNTLTVRPAVIGITPPNGMPPTDVVQHYFELVGLKPTPGR